MGTAALKRGIRKSVSRKCGVVLLRYINFADLILSHVLLNHIIQMSLVIVISIQRIQFLKSQARGVKRNESNDGWKEDGK